MYKCHVCYLLFSDEDTLMDEKRVVCPICKNELEAACELDHACECIEEISSGTRICPSCKQFICPCGAHDAFVMSRITGYLGELSGWNNGKRAEFADRTHYDVA
jgi:hypothetical protein